MREIFHVVIIVLSLQVISCTLNAQCGTVKDVDGNVYHTVKIGKQCWMKENLKTTHFRDGSAIKEIEDNNAWSNTDQSRTPAWCYFDADKKNNDTYGKLYNWYAVSDARNVCPAGWHVPTDGEYQELSNFLGGDTVSGGHMKAVTLWDHPNTGADNSSGFTALPAGYRISSGYFSVFEHNGLFWSSTAQSDDNAWLRNLCYNYANALRLNDYKSSGFSVRCVEN